MRVLATCLAFLVCAGNASAQSDPPMACPAIAVDPDAPKPEGSSWYVSVGELCPPAGQSYEDSDLSIDFGDGQRSTGVFAAREGGFSFFIARPHVYRRAGRYRVVGSATNRRTSEVFSTARIVNVPNAKLAAARVPLARVQTGARVRRVVGQFRDANPLAEPVDYVASIRWGDGTRSQGEVRRQNGLFQVVSSHTFRRPGRRLARVTLSDDRNGRLHLHRRFEVRR